MRADDSAARAAAAAAGAAAHAEVEIREVATLAEAEAAQELQVETWGRSPSGPPASAELIRALSHAGGYAALAVGAGGGAAGVLAGFFGLGHGGPHLHSHVLCVTGAAQGKGVAFAMKQHQRAWCLERGVAAVRWTFDPLVRRNAHFNLAKLGARFESYEIDFYGPMHDEQNAGDPGDRIVVRWDLLDPLAQAAADGRPAPAPDAAPGSTVVALPDDIVALRRRDPEAARRWRFRVRSEMTDLLAAGGSVAGVTRQGGYVVVGAAREFESLHSN